MRWATAQALPIATVCVGERDDEFVHLFPADHRDRRRGLTRLEDGRGDKRHRLRLLDDGVEHRRIAVIAHHGTKQFVGAPPNTASNKQPTRCHPPAMPGERQTGEGQREKAGAAVQGAARDREGGTPTPSKRLRVP